MAGIIMCNNGTLFSDHPDLPKERYILEIASLPGVDVTLINMLPNVGQCMTVMHDELVSLDNNTKEMLKQYNPKSNYETGWVCIGMNMPDSLADQLTGKEEPGLFIYPAHGSLVFHLGERVARTTSKPTFKSLYMMGISLA